MTHEIAQLVFAERGATNPAARNSKSDEPLCAEHGFAFAIISLMVALASGLFCLLSMDWLNVPHIEPAAVFMLMGLAATVGLFTTWFSLVHWVRCAKDSSLIASLIFLSAGFSIAGMLFYIVTHFGWTNC